MALLLPLIKQLNLPFASPVEISYIFYMKDLIRRDVSNLLESINDLLVDIGVLSDDNWKVVSIGKAYGRLDRENPRCEVTIEPKKGNL